MLAQFGRESALLATAAREVLGVLFPYDTTLPELISRPARGGAQWALALLLSWYPDADFKVFNEGLQDGTAYPKLRLLEGFHRTV